MAIPVSAALFLAAALASIAALWRNDPASVNWEGDRLVLRNRAGLVCRRIDLPCRPGLDSHAPADWGNHLRLADLDGDGVNEVIAIHGSAPGGQDLLSALDRHGRVLWRLRSPELLGPLGPVEAGVLWRPFYLRDVVPAGGGGSSPELLGLRRSVQGSLTVLERIDARTGTILGALRNAGHIETSWLVDLDGDGIAELTFAGTDNRSGRALALVLDPRRLDGGTNPGAGLAGIASMADPEGLRAGVVAAWSFALDRFSVEERAGCVKVESGADGSVICTVGDANHPILYSLRADPPQDPVVIDVRLTDHYRAELRARPGSPVDGEGGNLGRFGLGRGQGGETEFPGGAAGCA